MAHSQSAGFGSLSNDRNEPLHFNSDSLIFNQEKNIAELFDGVEIIQGKSILSAEYVKAIYSKSDNKLEKILAEYAEKLEKENKEFTLRKFFKNFNEAGNIPVSLVRWEMLDKID